MKLEDYVGKSVRIKSKCNHPHAGETGIVLQVANINGLNKKGLIVKEENFGAEFFVFNTNHLQILD